MKLSELSDQHIVARLALLGDERIRMRTELEKITDEIKELNGEALRRKVNKAGEGL